MKPSSYIEFAQKIKGSGWSMRHLRRKFLKQVDKGDYEKKDLKALLKHLEKLAHGPKSTFPREKQPNLPNNVKISKSQK